eukprot:7344814-Pyramimonas_sp.AAC.1
MKNLCSGRARQTRTEKVLHTVERQSGHALYLEKGANNIFRQTPERVAGAYVLSDSTESQKNERGNCLVFRLVQCLLVVRHRCASRCGRTILDSRSLEFSVQEIHRIYVAADTRTHSSFIVGSQALLQDGHKIASRHPKTLILFRVGVCAVKLARSMPS